MTDDTDDPALDRRRQKRASEHRRRLLTVVALFLVAVGAVVGVFAWGLNRTRDAVVEPVKGAGERVPEKVTGDPPADWTHAELAAYLKKRGVGVSVEGGGMSSGLVYSTFLEPETGQQARVGLAADAKSAREFAASDPKCFAWGRFVVRRFGDDSDPYAAKIKAALR